MCIHKLDVNRPKITAHKWPSMTYGNNLWIPLSNLTEDSREHLAPSPNGFSSGVTASAKLHFPLPRLLLLNVLR